MTKVKPSLRITTLIMLLALIAVASENEQNETGWEREMVGSFNGSQTNFDNWKKGGENSWSWQINLNSKFIYNNEQFKWVNNGLVNYGKNKVSGNESKKASDELKISSVFTYKLGLKTDPYVSITGQTQVAKGYEYADTLKIAVSDFMDPVYLLGSLGMAFEPTDNLTLRLGASLKETFTNNYPVPYADNPKTTKIEKIKFEYGVDSVIDFSTKFAENILLTSTLELFSNLHSLEDIDVNWDTMLNAKISKYISANFNVKLFYDNNISKKRQIKNTLMFGVSYSFL